jgi:hypothetical protein
MQQALAEKKDLLRLIALRVEVTAPTITAPPAVIHVPDSDTEFREIGYDRGRDALYAVVSVEQREKFIEKFGCLGDETIMDIDSIGTKIEHFHAPRR